MPFLSVFGIQVDQNAGCGIGLGGLRTEMVVKDVRAAFFRSVNWPVHCRVIFACFDSQIVQMDPQQKDHTVSQAEGMNSNCRIPDKQPLYNTA